MWFQREEEGNLEEALQDYDAIFINSSDAISVAGTDMVLKNWVEDGGSLYVSGTAVDYISNTGSSALVFPAPDPYVGSANSGGEFITGIIRDEAMSDETDIILVDLQYPDYNWVPVIDTNYPANVLIDADASEIIDIGAIRKFSRSGNATVFSFVFRPGICGFL